MNKKSCHTVIFYDSGHKIVPISFAIVRQLSLVTIGQRTVALCRNSCMIPIMHATHIRREKNKHRLHLNQALHALSKKEMAANSIIISTKLTHWLHKHRPRSLGAFYPQTREPNIWPVIEQYATNHLVYMPKFNAITATYAWATFNPVMAIGPFGIPEPSTAINANVHLDACLVPALGVDSHLNRLGWGYGYFDRLLSHRPPHRLGIVFSVQLMKCILPTNAWDIPLTDIMTPVTK